MRPSNFVYGAPVRTKVAIVGGGPAGMLLSHLLWRADIDNVVIEQRSREYVEARIRAGVIEQGTSDLLRSLGLGSRMDREGFVHEGVTISNNRVSVPGRLQGAGRPGGDGLRADRDPEGSLRLRRRCGLADRVRSGGRAAARLSPTVSLRVSYNVQR